MRIALLAAAAASLWVAAPSAFSEDTPVAPRDGAPTIPLERLIAEVAKKTGRVFVVDPRVRADVLVISRTTPDFTYDQLLGVLEIYGFAAFQDVGFVRVVPDTMIRTEAMPTITAKDTRPASEYVTEIVTVKNVSAPQLVPILRPLLPQYASMVALPQTNSVILTDRFANLRRIEELIRILDNTPVHRSPGAADTEH